MRPPAALLQSSSCTLPEEPRQDGGASGVPRFTEERAKRCQESAIGGRTGAAKTSDLLRLCRAAQLKRHVLR